MTNSRLGTQAVDGDVEISADDEDPLQVIFDETTGHLTDEHAAFFKEWERLISLEEQELVRYKKEIWTLTADEREQAGRYVTRPIDRALGTPR